MYLVPKSKIRQAGEIADLPLDHLDAAELNCLKTPLIVKE